MAKKKKGAATIVTGGLGTSRPGTYVHQPGVPAAPLPQNPYVASTPPIDPAFEAYKVSSARNVALSNADATYQNARIENQYGLGADTSNPYSQAKMLEESYKRSQRGTLNSYASQGQLHSGAYGRMQGENQRNYNIGYDELARSYKDAKYGVVRSQLGTYANSVAGVDDAQFAALLRALGG